MSDLFIFGNGELAELAYFYFKKDTHYEVRGFIVDDEFKIEPSFAGLPIYSLTEALEFLNPNRDFIHVAVSYKTQNRNRQRIFERFKELGFELPSYISPDCINNSVSIGENCFILELNNIQFNVNIGDNVVLWSGNHIGHGTKIHDHVYIASHCVVSGNCEIGARSWLGVNATIADFIYIEKDCFITMGCNVTKNLNQGSVVLDGRSDIIDGKDIKAKKIRSRYFGIIE